MAEIHRDLVPDVDNRDQQKPCHTQATSRRRKSERLPKGSPCCRVADVWARRRRGTLAADALIAVKTPASRRAPGGHELTPVHRRCMPLGTFVSANRAMWLLARRSSAWRVGHNGATGVVVHPLARSEEPLSLQHWPEEGSAAMRAREIMSSPAITVQASTPVTDAAVLLEEKGFTGLPVTDDEGNLIGIVTEADLIRNRIAADPRLHGQIVAHARPRRVETVADVMTTPVESLTPGADVADVARMMLAENIRCFPIVDGRRIVGVVTRRDVLRAGVTHPDWQLRDAVVARLAALDDSVRYSVTVQAGVAEIEDSGLDDRARTAADWSAAERAAADVPGIVAIIVKHAT